VVAHRISAAGGAVLDGYELGTGVEGVVLVPELGAQGLCGWWPYGGFLAGKGYHVLVFDHRCMGRSTCPGPSSPTGLMDDLVAVTADLVRDGAHRVVLVGASQGGAEVLIAGARPPTGVVGIAAISADELGQTLSGPPYPATATAAAPALSVPALFAVATDDRFVSLVDTRSVVASVPTGRASLLVLPAGSGHGWDMLTRDASGRYPTLDTDLEQFLSDRLAPPQPPCPGAPAARTLRAGTLAIDVLGAGPVTVVASNQSDQDRCAWASFASTLVARGYRVALWDYGPADPPTELAAVAAAVHADGSDPVVLMGASKGAKTSPVTARRMSESYVVGVVSLSAEATLAPNIDVASACAGLPTPVLLVTADSDPYGSAQALDPIRRGLPGARPLLIAGDAHGTALLADAAVVAAVESFLASVSH
jgi:pimeloyl-ACP methyl ester carboxylesterase